MVDEYQSAIIYARYRILMFSVNLESGNQVTVGHDDCGCDLAAFAPADAIER